MNEYIAYCGLRRFSEDDAEAMYQNWASDLDVTQFLTRPPHTSIKVSQEILEDWVAAYEKDNYYHWAIVLKERGNDPIGGICAVNQNDNLSIIHIGYCLGKAWWNPAIFCRVFAFVIEILRTNRLQLRYMYRGGKIHGFTRAIQPTPTVLLCENKRPLPR